MDNRITQGQAIAKSQAADQKRSIPYRPQYNLITQRVTASILLQQINFWWHIQKRKPFYKFRAKCNHKAYREGDSWTEELGMTGSEFDTALKTIGGKVTTGIKKTQALENNLVIYWTDSNRVTWYQLNEELFGLMVYLAYQEPKLLGNSGFRKYLENSENLDYLITEITTENTTNKPVLSSSKTSPKQEPTVTQPVTEKSSTAGKPPTEEKQEFVSEKKLDVIDLAAHFASKDKAPPREHIRDALADALGVMIPNDDFMLKPWSKATDSLVGAFREMYGKKRIDAALSKVIIAAIGDAKKEDGWHMCKGPTPVVVSRIVEAGRNGRERGRAGEDLAARQAGEKERMQEMARAHGHG